MPQGPLSFLSSWLAVCAPVSVYAGWRDLRLDTDLYLYAGNTDQLGAARICVGHLSVVRVFQYVNVCGYICVHVYVCVCVCVCA